VPFKSCVLGTAKPFCLGIDSGEAAEPSADEFDDAGGLGRRFSVTVVMVKPLRCDLHPSFYVLLLGAGDAPHAVGCAWVSTERANLGAVPHWQKIQASRC
jgi:hypothetical protein